MTDLIDEVRESFQSEKDRLNQSEGSGPTLLRIDDPEVVSGFNAMRAYFEPNLLAVARRGYRFFAGSPLPEDTQQLLEQTTNVMLPRMTQIVAEAFSCGVLIGHRSDYYIQMKIHFNQVDDLFGESRFQEAAVNMTGGFIEDSEIQDYFLHYVFHSLLHLTQVTGFRSGSKIWDVWLLTGTSCVTAAFLAGHRLGTTWRERDVLSGIEIATEGDTYEP